MAEVDDRALALFRETNVLLGETIARYQEAIELLGIVLLQWDGYPEEWRARAERLVFPLGRPSRPDA